MSKEAMKLALEALEMSHELDDTGYADAKKYGLASDEDITAKLCTAITALREALAEQPAQQEPAGSVYRYGKDSSGKQWHGIRWTASGLDLPDGTLIYTSPPQQEPQGYAGITIWGGDVTITRIFTELEIKHARFSNELIKQAVQQCLDELAAHGITGENT